MDGFGIFDSFSGRDTFDLFGGGSGTLNPAASLGGSTPITATSNSSTTSGSSGSGGGSDWGGFLSNALNRSLDFVGGLASIDLFGRAQNAGLVPAANQTAQTGGTQTGGTQTGGTQTSTSVGNKLPSWVVPVGAAVMGLVAFKLLTK